ATSLPDATQQALQATSLQQLQIEKQPVIKFTLDTPAMHAMYLLNLNNARSAAVVDDGNRLVAVLSASDIKLIRPRQLTALLEPVSKFIQRAGVKPPIVAAPQTSIATVLYQMSLYRI